MSKYKNIIFDLGGVLLNIDYNLTRQAFIDLGIPQFDQFYSQANANQLFQKLENGTIEASQFYKELNHLTGLHLTNTQIEKAWNAMLLDFRDKSLEYLIDLKKKVNVLLLSNTNRIHTDALQKIYYNRSRKIAFEAHFNHCIYSYDTGYRKPDAEIYQWVLQRYQIKPEESLFIDDSLQNVEGAESVGIDGILLNKGVLIEEMGLPGLIRN